MMREDHGCSINQDRLVDILHQPLLYFYFYM